jgi:hypothetical protein
MKITMESIEAHRYGGVLLKPGEKFQVNGQRDARLLAALGKAKEVTTEPAEAPRFVPAIGSADMKKKAASEAPPPTKKVAALETAAPRLQSASSAQPEPAPAPAPEPAPAPAPAPEPAREPVPAPAPTTDSAVAGLSSKDATGKRPPYKRRDLTAEE